MNLRTISWAVVAALSVTALLRPVASIVEYLSGVDAGPALPIALTVGISVLWIAVVGLTPVRRPVATLIATGIAYAVLSTVLAAVLSPLLTGELQGPFVAPAGLVAVLVTNVLWGAVAGLLALAVQRMRGMRHPLTAGEGGSER